MVKPTNDKIKRIKLDMASIEIKTCALCYKEAPPPSPTTDEEPNEIDWIECMYCKLWLHRNCVTDCINASEELICYVCKK